MILIRCHPGRAARSSVWAIALQAIVLLGNSWCQTGFAQGYDWVTQGVAYPDRVLVQCARDVPVEEWGRFETRHGLKLNWLFREMPDLALVTTEPGRDLTEVLAECRNCGLFDWAEPDYMLHSSLTPNDPAFLNNTAWGLRNAGAQNGKRGSDIQAEDAWDIRMSARDVIVAVIDSGIRYTHEDLANNMWRNPGEIPSNFRDDDHNGLIDDVFGFNAVDNNGDPFDESGHGSHVAGIIGAVGNNARGTVGVAWDIQLMGLKFLEESGSGATSDAIRCIDYAISHGAHIINASWGSGMRSRSLQLAIQRAGAEGIVFVTAAGNEGQDLDLNPDYPAAYTMNNIVAVAATDRNDLLAGTSNFGATSIDLGAPGVDIYSAWSGRDNAYLRASGTSMAAPFVSGALALLMSEFTDRDYKEWIRAVLDSVDPVASLQGKTVSGGRLNVANALNRLKAAVITVQPPKLSLEFSGGLVRLLIQGEPIFDYRIQWSTDLIIWNTFSKVTTDSKGYKSQDVSIGGGNRVFYRVIPAL